jgi:hypothetical protein
MTTAPHPHELLLQQIQQEYANILAHTSQGIYIYLDDPHWICNEKLATMLGYSSAGELSGLAKGSSILDVMVVAESQQRVVDAYMNAVNNKVASIVPVAWKKKGGAPVKTQTIFVPISFKGTVLTLHFVTPV